jgi:hypothetical protein
MRRFLEAFMHFKFLGVTGSERWNKCFGDAAERVRKYVDIGSHETATRATRIPDRQEAVEVSKIILAMLERIDKEHYNGLVSVVQD